MTINSTTENLVQDNSSTECVSSETNPITTVQTDVKNLTSANSLFDFNATHNGEACIESLDPKDTIENRFWFTIAMLVAIYKESNQTIRNNIESLYQDGELGLSRIFERRINIEDSCGVPHPTTIYNLTVLNRLGMCCFRKNKEAKKARRIQSVSDMKQTYIQDSCGVPHETTLYNLNVLNQLAMVCIDNEKLNDISCKFSDILSSCEVLSRGSLLRMCANVWS